MPPELWVTSEICMSSSQERKRRGAVSLLSGVSPERGRPPPSPLSGVSPERASPMNALHGAAFGRSMRKMIVREEPPTLLGRVQERLTSPYAIKLALGVAVVCVTYAFAVRESSLLTTYWSESPRSSVTRHHLSHVTSSSSLLLSSLE